MSRFCKAFSCAIIAVLLLGMCFIAEPRLVNARETACLSIVNPFDGSNNFAFICNQTVLGDTFTLNVTITNVTALNLWQFSMGWDPKLITYVSYTLPSDNVFAGGLDSGGSLQTYCDTFEVPSGTLTLGAHFDNQAQLNWSFNGTGTLVVLTMQITGAVTPSLPVVTCPIQFQDWEGDWTSTFLLNEHPGGITGLPFTVINAVYKYVSHDDVAVVDVSVNRSWIYESQPVNVSVTIANLGDFKETANLFLCRIGHNNAGGDTFAWETVNLFPNETETLTFTWNTADIEPREYTLRAYVKIPFDINMTNNVLDSTVEVEVRTLGDVNGDGTVSMRDVADAILAFNSFPGTLRWNPFADIYNKGRVDMRDISVIVLNFNKHE